MDTRGISVMVRTDLILPAFPKASSPKHPLSVRGCDVRLRISWPSAGDDMDNLACEFSAVPDMVLRLHAPVQAEHARTVWRGAFKRTFIEYSYILLPLIKNVERF